MKEGEAEKLQLEKVTINRAAREAKDIPRLQLGPAIWSRWLVAEYATNGVPAPACSFFTPLRQPQSHRRVRQPGERGRA